MPASTSDEWGLCAPVGIAGSMYIMQDRITRSRLAGEPPDVALAPRLTYSGPDGF